MIVALDGEPIKGEADLPRRISLLDPGDHVTLDVIRDGELRADRGRARGAPERDRQLTGGEARRIGRELALALREEIAPRLGSHAGRAHAGAGFGGDVTFAIDEQAESFMEEFLADRAPELAFYSEDRGLVVPAGDPALGADRRPDRRHPAGDGGLRGGLRLGRARRARRRRADDRRRERGLRGRAQVGSLLYAERGGGLDPAPALSANGDLSRMFWSYGLRGRPARETIEVLAELIDASSVGGGTFDLGSASYDMTRIATGQLDAYVEPGPRMVADVPGMRERFERVGGGAVLNNSPYDLAAAALCLEEAGAVVSDAYGALARESPACSAPGPSSRSPASPPPTATCTPRSCASIERGIERLVGRPLGSLRRVLQEVAARPEVARRLHAHRRTRADRADPRARRGAEGQAGAARQRDGVRRRGLGDPLHAGAADARRRPRRALAGDPRPRGLLQRHQADAQLAPGRPGVDLPTSSGRCSRPTTR